MLFTKSTAALTAFFSSLASALSIPSELTSRSANGLVNVAYFPNWDIYGRNYQPTDVPVDRLTHLVYCFANIQSDGTVVLSDSYADLQKHYSDDSWNDSGNNAYGNVKKMLQMKKKNRNLKTLFSIGGWTYSSNFAAPMATTAGRAQFVNTAVQFVKDLGFDGVDIDWEYPADTTQAANFVSLLQELRGALDAYTSANGGNRLLITTAMPAGPTNYQHLDLAGMNNYVDLFNLMAYDYAGSFSSVSGHQANLYNKNSNPAATPFNTDQAVAWYTSHGVPSNKLTLGMPIYGRAFDSTAGPGQSYSGVGSGSWENGVWDYKVLPQAGAQETWDDEAGALYSYDSNQKIMISYDNAMSVGKKTSYLLDKGLGGAMWWELSGDYNDTRSLTLTAWNQLKGAGAMDSTQNTLSYPASQYDNVKTGSY